MFESFPIRRLLLFAVLNLADFGLTWHLIEQTGGLVYESNPVANYWLTRHGWAGLAGFKAATALVAAGLAVGVRINRPSAGNRILTFGCVVLAAVVTYSGVLAVKGERHPQEDPSTWDDTRLNERLQAELVSSAHYRREVTRISIELAAGRASLAEGVDQLLATSKAHDAEWQQTLRSLYPGVDARGRLAVNLVQFTLEQDAGRSKKLIARLRQELKDYCGTDLMACSQPLHTLIRRLAALDATPRST